MDELFQDMLSKGLISVEHRGELTCGELHFTLQQAVSYAILTSRHYVDYIQRLDYDAIDWLDWCKVHEN
jgi:hypothetical protein